MFGSENKELSSAISRQLDALCARGDALAQQKKYSEAITVYWQAWDLPPEPGIDWEAAVWILAAIGDAHFLSRDFITGRDNLKPAPPSASHGAMAGMN